MSQDKRPLLSQIFIALMIFTGLTWAWTVAFIVAWPWDKNSDWKPEYRLPVVCAKQAVCGIAYGQLNEARQSGQVTGLIPQEAAGEVQEPDNWLIWKKVEGKPWQFEAKASSWHFQTVVRYRVDHDVPVLVEVQDVTGKALYYGIGAGLFSLLGLYLRKLRG